MSRKYLTLPKAIAMLVDGDYVHCFKSGPGLLIGADWSRDEVIKALTKGRPELAGAMAASMNHAIYCDGNFFATKSKDQ